jgi:heat shock protein HtpX
MKLSPTVKTGLLLAVLTALLGVIGYLISGVGGLATFLLLGVILNFISYWFSDRVALMMAGAEPLQESQAPEIYSDTAVLSKAMGIPMPRLYYTKDQQPNAFATGRNPENSAVCVTQGLVNVLNRDEIRGVLAHELGHIKNRDVLISTIAAVIAGAVSSIAQIGVFFSGSSSDRDRNPLVDLVVLLFAPISATLIQLTISRTREYEADATAARYTTRPQDLANALIKIESAVNQIPYVEANPSLSSLFISNPFRGNGLLELLSTHPPTAKRVEKLMAMKVG